MKSDYLGPDEIAAQIEAVQSIGVVNYAFILQGHVEAYIAALKPEVVVKGKEHEEHESKLNPERACIESYGGRLLFSSGESIFSSVDLLRHELGEIIHSSIKKPLDYPARHNFLYQDFVKM